MKKTIVNVAATALLLTGAGHASAQDRSSTRGPTLGGHLNASAIQLDEENGGEAERGVGLGLVLGYGISDQLALFLRGEAADVAYESENEGSYTLANVDLGGRYSFGTGAVALRPYAELGISGTRVANEVDVEGEMVDVTLSGGAVFLGGGVEYFFSRRAALDVGLTVGKGRFTSLAANGESLPDFEDLDFTTSRLRVGVSFHP